jgi:hypothetical protein
VSGAAAGGFLDVGRVSRAGRASTPYRRSTIKKREVIGVEMERGGRGAEASLPLCASLGNESKHYFNATVVSNACAIGVASERKEEISGGIGKAERSQSRGAEAKRVQVSPPLWASPSGTVAKHYLSATFVSKRENRGLLLAQHNVGNKNSRLIRVNGGRTSRWHRRLHRRMNQCCRTLNLCCSLLNGIGIRF